MNHYYKYSNFFENYIELTSIKDLILKKDEYKILEI